MKDFSLSKYLATFILQLAFAMIFFQPVLADDFELADEFLEGSSSTTFRIDTENEAGAGDFITLQFGDAVGKTLVWDIDNSRFTFSDSVRVEGNSAIVGQLFVADDHDATDSNGFINLGKNSNSFESISWNDAADSFNFSDDIDLNLNQLIESRIENLASAPTCDNASRGRLYHNTTNNNSFVCNGTTFVRIDDSGSGSGDNTLSAVQARRSSGFSIGGSFSDVTLNQTDVENNPSVVEHDNTNTDRILIKATGVYAINYEVTVNNGSATVSARVRSNDATVLNGSLGLATNVSGFFNTNAPITRSFLASLNSGDFISLQLQSSNTVSTNNDVLFNIMRLDNISGSGGGGGGGNGWVDDGSIVRLETATDQIGIGTTSPDGFFEVSRGTVGGANHISMRISDSENNDDYNLGFSTTDPEKITFSAEEGTARQVLQFGDIDSLDDTIFGVGTSIDSGASWQPAFVITNENFIGIGTNNPTTILDIEETGEVIELGDGSAADSFINFDDGTARNFGWDDSEGSLSTFNQQLRFRVRQSSNPPVACSGTVTGMLWFDTDTGITYACDTSNGRNKWLSTSEFHLSGGEGSTCNAGAAQTGEGCTQDIHNGVNAGDMGYQIPRNATIVGGSFHSDVSCTNGPGVDLEVAQGDNGGVTALADILTGCTDANGCSAVGTNIDVNLDQIIRARLDNNCTSGNIDDWSSIILLRWRHD